MSNLFQHAVTTHWLALSPRFLGKILCLSVPLLLLPSASLAAKGDELLGQVAIVDGDTIKFGKQRVRLWGVDAPESSQLCYRDGSPWRCGAWSANALYDLVGRRHVRCVEVSQFWNRPNSICYLGDVSLNEWVVQQGLAVASRRYSKDQYVGLEAMAMSGKLGIWQSDFVLPYRWRKGDRLADGQPRYWPEQ